MEKVNLAEKFSHITEQWDPKVVGELNGQEVRLAKIQGHNFVMHCHEEGEEMFFVIRGNITLEFEDKKVALQEGEFYIVPRGVMHRPVADEEAEIMLFEVAETVNTGNIINNYTINKGGMDKI